MLSNSQFIKPQAPFHKAFNKTNPSSMFCKYFHLDKLPKSATLCICALGIGYAYINGKRVSEDLFAAPPSDYEKRLWYMRYDVGAFLKEGENVIAVLCGNGFFNEDMQNAWGSTDASWRDYPKMIATLSIDGEPYLHTDGTWHCSTHTPYLMNRYRQGVVYDARIPAPDSSFFDGRTWDFAAVDERAPKGVFTPYEGEPIRALKIIPPIAVDKRNKKKLMVDFGVNMSGFVRLFTDGKAGTKITIRYGETLTEDGEIYAEENMRTSYFPQGEFATEHFICNGAPFVWNTLLSYYGFRYAEISCEDLSALEKVEAVFVAQDISPRSHFECSDPFLNKLFACGIQATKSNMFYMPTDCPTREKYGWMNDAQSSAEQILTNFHAEKMLLQWNVNICDALDDEKGLPGIVPTHGWGYQWGNGPVSDGSLFEQVYRVYLHSGNPEGLVYNLPYFKRYFAFLKTREDEEGLLHFGLYDWANPNENICSTPLELINAIYRVKFNRIAGLAARLAKQSDEEFLAEEKRQISIIKKHWFLPKGGCHVREQAAISMLIYHGIYDDLAPLKEQLKACVEEKNYHHNCGMVGLRHLYMALNICGLQEYAMKIVTAKGYPSYREWLDRGATTLWEMWDCGMSRNHHMYSDVLSWMMKTVAGISPDDTAPSFEKIQINPYFFRALDYATAYYDSPKGRVGVAWKRTQKEIILEINAPCDGYVYYQNEAISKGKTQFSVITKAENNQTEV